MAQTTTLKIHPKMIVGLSGMIPGGVSIEDFCAVTKMSPIDSRQFLNELLKSQIGTKRESNYYFEDGDKLKTAIILLETWISNR